MQSENIAELAKALNKAQYELKPAIKDSNNPYFKSKYADLSSIVDACKEALYHNGLSYVQYGVQTDKPNTIAIGTKLIHVSGQWLEGVLEMPLVKLDPQSVGSATSYARRYALAAMVGVVTEDDDGESAMRNVPQSSGRPEYDPYLQNVGGVVNTPQQQDEYSANKKAIIEEIKQLREYAKLSPEQVIKVVGHKYSARMTLDELTIVKETLTDFVERVTTNRLTPEDTAILLEGKVA